MIRVRPIHHTPHADEWGRMLEALGAVCAVENGPWREYDTASGTIAINGAPADDAVGFVGDDLEGLLASLRDAGIDAGPTDAAPGPALEVRAASGLTFLVDAAYREPLRVPGGLAVLQIWYQPDLAEVARIYRALGLVPRIVSDDAGGWADYSADGGGLAAQHPASEPGIDATSFEYAGDLDALCARVCDAGFDATIVDEAYNRTLLVSSPDGGQVWVNGTQDDLYGYHRAD